MGKFNKLQSGFQLGEIGPKSYSLTDIEEYFKGCSQLKNFLPLKNGGIAKRGGAEHIVDLKSVEKQPGIPIDIGGAALIPFIYSKDDAYTVAIKFNGTNNNWCAIIKNDGVPAYVDDSRFNIGNPVPSPAANLDMNGFTYAQIGNTLIICHNSGTVQPISIRGELFSSGGSFVIEDFGANKPILKPYQAKNITDTAFTPSATATGPATLSSNNPIFTAEHVGQYYKISHGAFTGLFYISGFIDASNVNIYIQEPLGGTTATTDWEEASWSNKNGYPRTVATFEQRLIFGGNENQPDTIWGSRTGNIYHLMVRKYAQDQDQPTDNTGNNYYGADDPTDPFEFTLASGEVNKISWITSNRVLNVGTLGEEYVGSGGDVILSNTSVNFTPHTSYGGNPTQAIRVNNDVIYITRDGRAIRNFIYSNSNGSNTSNDLTSLADHLSNYGGDLHGFEYMIFHKSRSIIWIITRNKALVGFTYSRENGVLAWHKHSFGGVDVQVHGICTIPNSSGDWDDLYISLTRTVNGATVASLEKISADFDYNSMLGLTKGDSYKPIFLDASISGIATAVTNTISGLNHLENEEVSVVLNGTVDPAIYTVTAGSVILPNNMAIGDEYIVGLPYTSTVDTVDLEGGGDFGTSQGLTQRIDRATIKFYNTLDAKVGSPKFADRMETVSFGNLEGYTEKRINLSTGPDRDQRIRIESSKPLPCTVLGVVARGVTYD